MAEVRININGTEVTGHKGQTILEIAKANGFEIPTLCYDERVKIYGSCGLCVVEVEGIPKLLRACATEAADGMVVKTHTDRVKGSRKIALELLLSDHVGDCRAPCVLACPANIDCQGYVGLIANGQFKESLKLIKEELPLPASIGRVCPHPCETACRRELLEEPVSIAQLKSFVADIDLQDPEIFMPDLKPSTGKKVAIVGGGPSGLTAAYFLAVEGHHAVIYDYMPEMGGMLRYGIPEYRLPAEVLDSEIDIFRKMGIEMKNNVTIGKDITLDHLRESYDAVYIAIGAWTSSGMRCEGEDLEGVIGGIEFLRSVTLGEPVKIGNRVAIVGGGNTAMDACRVAVRLGAKEVVNLYRRTRDEMPAEDIEIIEAEEEGVEFKFLVSPMEVIGEDGKVSKIKLQKMELGEPDESGRRRPVPIEGAEEVLEVDSVIVAIGQNVDNTGFEDLEYTKWGTIIADENGFTTNLPGVFAGGDAINDGPDIAITAIAHGKRAALALSSYLEGKLIPYKPLYHVTRDDVTAEMFADKKIEHRPKMAQLSPAERKDNFNEIVAGYTVEQAMEEAMRCLECGCHDVFECQLFEYANEYDVEPERLAGEVHHRKCDDGHPFIIRDSDKCILCGLCVRVCDEVIGATALGLIDRGFDTIVKPAFDTPLKDTTCVSCGQCIAVCPTGALQERMMIPKSQPIAPEVTQTVCSHCSVGCNVDLTTKGNLVTRSMPNKESSINDSLLCVKGRFGYDLDQIGARITKPLIRKDGELTEVEWDEALLYVSKKAQSLGALYGNDVLALSVSDRYTNEEIHLISKLGKDVLKTDKIVSFNNVRSGLKDVLGYDASTNTFDELSLADTILLVGTNIMTNNPIAGFKIKQAVKDGAKLAVINDNPVPPMDNIAAVKVSPGDNLGFLKEILKSLIDSGKAPNADLVDGFEDLKASLADVKVSEEAANIAEMYGNAKKAMIVFGQKAITPDAAALIANIALVSGNIGKARKGIIQLKQNNNSQGLVDMGVSLIGQDIAGDIENGSIKGLLVFGEDIPGVNLDSLDLLVVQDTHLTETAKKADVVLPGAGFAESSGTYTNTERRVQRINQAIKPLVEYENWKVVLGLANVLTKDFNYPSLDHVLEDIEKSVPEYLGLRKAGQEAFWPLDGSRVLYTDGFNFPDKKAKLKVVEDGPLYAESINTNNLTNTFVEYLEEEGLAR